MTEIHLHGILAHKYGAVHKLAIKRPKDLFLAMEANYDNFMRDLKDLAQKNIYYTCVVDKKWLKNQDFCFENKKIKRIDVVPAVAGSGPIGFAIASAVISVASAVYSYVQAGKVEYPKIPGASAATSANSRSLAFSNRENIVEQGNPVPLVYGRIKIGSSVIQSAIKSFPLSITLSQEFNNNSSRSSGGQGATIDNSIPEDPSGLS
jgi:predicted phage tail protein